MGGRRRQEEGGEEGGRQQREKWKENRGVIEMGGPRATHPSLTFVKFNH